MHAYVPTGIGNVMNVFDTLIDTLTPKARLHMSTFKQE